MMIKVLFVFVLICGVVLSQDASNDYQNTTYNAQFEPVSQSGSISVTAYFSPDNSVGLETELVENAKNTIDIGIPGFDSWSYCTDTYKGIYGCTVDKQRNQEAFPIFQALVNAINRGVQVRILTNYYSNTTYTPGYIDPLAFLKLQGAQVRYFTTLTFLHTKYMNIDGTTSSISSINYSQTSFMKNREAGVIIQNANQLTNFTNAVFEYDWDQSVDWPTISYSAADMKIIQDKSPLTVTIPPPNTFSGAYITKPTTVATKQTVEVFASPDFAFSNVAEDIKKSSSMKVYIYQITGTTWCDIMANYPGKLTILVSNDIFDQADWEAATQCYTQLVQKGITVRKTAYGMYTYSHQKYWILDDKIVYLSTGNMGDTDFPSGSNEFPAYDQDPSNWRKTNRDFNVKMTDSQLVEVYETLFEKDYALGYDYHPKSL
ncbi:hypothetical protein CYY_006915 [Polysphondylium violaceum]|uniref:Mitochondrial cardiolipin hydrolase n=1 Tax=Polysphondylium violaceum TaxID=133409 RepID=A0A8J4PQB3_9MYCE|nr:hypothetical protein CYY_006915 [Polysphondylium violaceum]